MKLQIAFDLTDLENALTIAQSIQNYADIFEVGSLLIHKYGIQAVTRFKQQFPNKIIVADIKLVDRAKETVIMAADAGADWVTVLAGAKQSTIHNACNAAHERGKKIMLIFIDVLSLASQHLKLKVLVLMRYCYPFPRRILRDLPF